MSYALIYRQAFKFELMPDGEQERDMRRNVGACRFVFNKALALQITNYAAGVKHASNYDMCKWLPAWKAECTWFKVSPSHTLQKALKNLDRAYTRFFKGDAKFPRFKRKWRGERFQEFDANCFKFDPANARVFLPKLGWMRYRKSREVLGTHKNVTVSLSCGRWFVSIHTEREIEQPVTNATTAIGIDVGINRFATMSEILFVACSYMIWLLPCVERLCHRVSGTEIEVRLLPSRQKRAWLTITDLFGPQLRDQNYPKKWPSGFAANQKLPT